MHTYVICSNVMYVVYVYVLYIETCIVCIHPYKLSRSWPTHVKEEICTPACPSTLRLLYNHDAFYHMFGCSSSRGYVLETGTAPGF